MVETSFRLSDNFVAKYKKQRPPFGFNGLGELVYMRTYSRIKPDGVNEQWWETVKRVVEGTYNMQKRWIEAHQLGWNPWRAQHSAQEMYDRIFNMKFLPPGRGLWAMGTEITESKGLFAALNNCSFVSTGMIKDDISKPFCFLMDMSMLGVGVGFDVRGEGKILVKGYDSRRAPEIYRIPDSREGWVESVRLLIDSYLLGTQAVEFDYSDIRPAGQPIKTFGGISAGPEPLKIVHSEIRGVLDANAGNPITARAIVDIMNMVGKCVVSGNVRRTAEIIFGDYHSEEYLDLKNYEVNPERESYGWTSNNSVFAEIGMDYKPICERIGLNGEPGFLWLDNARQFGRMQETEKNNRDSRAGGANPCNEQTLEPYELCCLVESFPNRHESLEDYLVTLKYAYLYAKTVTLGQTHWPETNRVMLRNRRIGCSMSGIAQFISTRGIDTLRKWCERGYKEIQRWDETYSEWLAIPKSIKTTSIKPSGSVSLLAGATPGMHYPESRFYLRRVRLSKFSPLLKSLKDAGYVVEPAFGAEETTVVVEIPVDVGEGIRTTAELTIWEQLALAAFLQKYWSDNQVSCTVTFDPEKERNQLDKALQYFQYELKGVSFLPRHSGGAYKQMPYEEITEAVYRERMKSLKPIKFKNVSHSHAEVELFCTTDYCEIKTEEQREVKN